MGSDLPYPNETCRDRIDRPTGGAGVTRHMMDTRTYRERVDRLGLLAAAANTDPEGNE